MRSLVIASLLSCSAPAPTPATCGADLEARIAADLRAIDLGNEALENSRTRLVDEHDPAILDRAVALLASEQVWNRADDRNCPPGAPTLSLFCALQQESIAVLGRYEHRRAGRDYRHRLRDYNNDPTTTLADVRSAITVARERVAARVPRCP